MNPAAEQIVRREVVVNADPEAAFDAFTERFGEFKPREHNLMPVRIVDTIFEPRVGGHIYDLGEDGSVCRWARIMVYDRPHRVVFSWDIGATWQIEQDPSNTSEVEVQFLPRTDGRTEVKLEHRHLDRHGPGWEGVSAGVADDAGWTLYLDRYAALPGASR